VWEGLTHLDELGGEKLREAAHHEDRRLPNLAPVAGLLHDLGCARRW